MLEGKLLMYTRIEGENDDGQDENDQRIDCRKAFDDQKRSDAAKSFVFDAILKWNQIKMSRLLFERVADQSVDRQAGDDLQDEGPAYCDYYDDVAGSFVVGFTQ